MSCPFCLIGSVSPPSHSPQNFSSPKGSAYILLSTPLVVAFLDIAPLSRGHLLLSSRAHRPKATDLTPGEAAAIGFWLPVLGRCVMTALWGGVEGNWNVIQANGKEAGQTVPHVHFHIIPRGAKEREGGEMTDEERKSIALGEGPRAKLSAEDGNEISNLVRKEIGKEVQRLKDEGTLVDLEGLNGELWGKTEERGLKL